MHVAHPNAEDIPFDLKHHRHLVYGTSTENLRALLRPEAEWLKSEVDKRRSQVFLITAKAENCLLEKTDWHADGNLDLEIEIRNASDRRSPEIDAVYLETTNGGRFLRKGKNAPLLPLRGNQSETPPSAMAYTEAGHRCMGPDQGGGKEAILV